MSRIPQKSLLTLLAVIGAVSFGASSASAATITLASGTGAIGSTDPNVIVNDPCGGPAGPGLIGAPYPGWDGPISGSQWVSPNNPDRTGCGGTYITTFTLPAGALSPTLSVSYLADNSADAALSGSTFQTTTQAGTCGTYFKNPPTAANTSSGFVSGTNTLTFTVDNCVPQYPPGPTNPTGIDFVGTVSYGTSADACKKGGWQTQTGVNGTSFKNQGDCVSYVETGGRNLAAG